MGQGHTRFAPDNDPGGQISAEAILHGATTFEGNLDRLVRLRSPQASGPNKEPIDRETIATRLRTWADVLQASTDLF